MDYHQILPKLFVGSYPQSTDDIEVLKREAGITAVLNVQTDDDLRHLDVDWDALLAHYNSCSIHLRRVPVRDFDAIDLEDKLPSCVFTLNQLSGVWRNCLSPLLRRCWPVTHNSDRLSLLVLRVGFGYGRQSRPTMSTLLTQHRRDRLRF